MTQITPTVSAESKENLLVDHLQSYANGLLSTDPESDVKLVLGLVDKYAQNFLLESIDSKKDLYVFRGRQLYLTAEQEKWLENHPGETIAGHAAPYIIFIVDPETSRIEAKMTVTRQNVHSTRTVLLESLGNNCDDDIDPFQELKCAQAHFEYASADREHVQDILKMRKDGDWLIRRGSNSEALVFSIKRPDKIYHYQYQWNGGWTSGAGKPKYKHISDVVDALQLSEFNSSFYR